MHQRTFVPIFMFVSWNQEILLANCLLNIYGNGGHIYFGCHRRPSWISDWSIKFLKSVCTKVDMCQFSCLYHEIDWFYWQTVHWTNMVMAAIFILAATGGHLKFLFGQLNFWNLHASKYICANFHAFVTKGSILVFLGSYLLH